VFGSIAPQAFAFWFPSTGLGSLDALSRVGMWLFIFLVGVELDLEVLRKVRQRALVISQTSIIVPFAAGAWLATALYPQFAGTRVPLLSFAVFLGAAMSITAFPVLVRILQERHLAKSEIGVLVIACAAVDDVSGWLLLAVMLALIHGGRPLLLWHPLIGLAAYILLMFFVARPLLRRAVRSLTRVENSGFGALLILLLVSCALTEWIGVHALFGAFILGLILPKHEWIVAGLRERLQPITTAFFLPLFFAVSGIRTDLRPLRTDGAWLLCFSVITVAIFAKFLGAALPARLLGCRWREAGMIGTLMNTRGLMELVFLNIGLELGILTDRLFSMMVLMALVTTVMAGPLLEMLRKERHVTEVAVA
jgi:Kef-type K+ transport system membrane component KefB